MIFPGVMCGCECWTIKKAEHWKIDAVELWCWRRLLRVPWTEKRLNQSFLKGMNAEYSWEYLMLKLKLETFGYWWEEPTHWWRPWCWERLKGKRKGGRRGWDGWMASLIGWTWVWANSKRSWTIGSLASYGSWRHSQRWLSNWTKATTQNCKTTKVKYIVSNGH